MKPFKVKVDVCSECGESWDEHLQGRQKGYIRDEYVKVSRSDCIRVLKNKNRGKDGAPGISGPPGAKGDTGPRGEQGPPGPPARQTMPEPLRFEPIRPYWYDRPNQIFELDKPGLIVSANTVPFSRNVLDSGVEVWEVTSPLDSFPLGSECPVHKKIHSAHGWYVCIPVADGLPS